MATAIARAHCSGSRQARYLLQTFDLYTSASKYSRIFDTCLVLNYSVGMKLSAYAKHLGISYQTAWRMWQRGELPAHQLPSGTVIVEVPPTPPAIRPQKVAVYARVSSAENRKKLEGQAEPHAAFSAAKGWQVAKVVKECGSGINDQRPQFLALLADTSTSHIVIEHKDRCSRFDSWLRVSPLEQGHPVFLPVQLATSPRQALAGKTPDSSTTLARKPDGWGLTLA